MHERDGQEGEGEDGRCEHRSSTGFQGGLDNRRDRGGGIAVLLTRLLLPNLVLVTIALAAQDGLDAANGIVHHDAQRHHEADEDEQVERLAEHMQHQRCAREGEHDRDDAYQRGPPAE